MAENEHTLWVITELYFPEMTSTGYYLTRIAEGLGADRTVKVICGQPNYSARGTVAPKRETLNNVEVFRVWGSRLDKNRIPFRVLNMLTLGTSVFLRAIKLFRRGDRILVVTTPPLMPFVVATASLMKGSSYTLLIHDTYPELLVAVKKTRADSIFFRIASRANRWLYKHAAKIIVVGRDMNERVSEKTRGLDVPIATIPNWAELESVEPRARLENPLLRDLGLFDKLVFLCAGNMGHPNDIESILDAAEIVEDENKIHFIFVGDGVKRKWIEKRVETGNRRNITLLSQMPRAEQNVFLNACDVGIVTLVTGMRGISMPSRTYNLMAAGKPILAICDEGSELDMVVKENFLGWSVRPHDPEALAKVIDGISKSKEQLVEDGHRSRCVAIAQYSLEVALSKYREELT